MRMSAAKRSTRSSIIPYGNTTEDTYGFIWDTWYIIRNMTRATPCRAPLTHLVVVGDSEMVKAVRVVLADEHWLAAHLTLVAQRTVRHPISGCAHPQARSTHRCSANYWRLLAGVLCANENAALLGRGWRRGCIEVRSSSSACAGIDLLLRASLLAACHCVPMIQAHTDSQCTKRGSSGWAGEFDATSTNHHNVLGRKVHLGG